MLKRIDRSINTCSASGRAVVLFVPLPLGGIILCMGRGVKGTRKKKIKMKKKKYLDNFISEKKGKTNKLILPVKRFGHLRSDVGGEES